MAKRAGKTVILEAEKVGMRNCQHSDSSRFLLETCEYLLSVIWGYML